MYCGFCLKLREHVGRFVDGPSGYICSDCVELCNEYLASDAHKGVKEKAVKCSFCGSPQEQVKILIPGPEQNICDQCVGLCNEILTVAAEEDKHVHHEPIV